MTSSPGEHLLPKLRSCLDTSDDEGVVRLMGVMRRSRHGRVRFHSLDKDELIEVLEACRRHDVAASARGLAPGQ